MQCQVKIIRCLALSLTLFLSTLTQADEVPWSMISYKNITILPYSSAQGEVISASIPYFNEISKMIWGWDPKNQLNNSSAEQMRAESSLTRMMKSVFVDFDVSDIKHFRKVVFTTDSGIKYRGLFGIHDFENKRPLVVLRMGLFGNIDEFGAERFFAKAMYEDLRMNILVLESMTSPGFLTKNENISFGGVDEGLQTFLALNYIQKTEFKKLISDYHILGVSMGALGSFFTTLLAENSNIKIQSVALFCPLINFKQTFDRHGEVNFKNAIADLWNSQRLKFLLGRYSETVLPRDNWKSLFDFRPRFTNSVMKILENERSKPLETEQDILAVDPKFKWPKLVKAHIETSKSFYDLNNFWSVYQGIKTPIKIYTTPNDPLVFNDLNSDLIEAKQQSGDFSQAKVVHLDYGIHCGLASVYKWDEVVSIIKESLVSK